MTDDTERRLADIEKRLARLEKLTEKPATIFDGLNKIYSRSSVPQYTIDGVKQWCDCGRDVCRAPDCPTHKKGGA